MALWSIITRVADGYPLCESTDPVPVTGAETQKTQAKQILKRLDARSPARLSVEAGAFLFSYAVDDGLAVLVMTDARFPKRLIFGFLRDAHAEFAAFVRGSHGDGWRAAVAAAAQPYAFLSFARVLSRLRREYADPESSANASRLAGELFDVQSIMRQNINEVLDRGEKLDRERAREGAQGRVARARRAGRSRPSPRRLAHLEPPRVRQQAIQVVGAKTAAARPVEAAAAVGRRGRHPPTCAALAVRRAGVAAAGKEGLRRARAPRPHLAPHRDAPVVARRRERLARAV